MKMMDIVEVLVEKKIYADDGVHKGMQGWICIEPSIKGWVLVNFPQYGEKTDIAEISMEESDLAVIPKMDARINERIKALWESKVNENN